MTNPGSEPVRSICHLCWVICDLLLSRSGGGKMPYDPLPLCALTPFLGAREYSCRRANLAALRSSALPFQGPATPHAPSPGSPCSDPVDRGSSVTRLGPPDAGMGRP